MLGYYVVRNGLHDWHVRYSAHGCNSCIVKTFKTAAAARAYARKANRL